MDQLGNKSGNYGGSIREAGGTLGAMGAAKENEYFKRVEEQKIEEMRKKLENESKDNKISKPKV